jgi:hypothetical protein
LIVRYSIAQRLVCKGQPRELAKTIEGLVSLSGREFQSFGSQRRKYTVSIARDLGLGLLALLAAVMVTGLPAAAQQKPNILVIMGDDIGWSNIGAYNQGLMYETEFLIDDVSDEVLEAAATEMDQRGITLGSPIWCPDPNGRPSKGAVSRAANNSA